MSSWKFACKCGASEHHTWLTDCGIYPCRRCGRRYLCVFREDWGHDWVEIFSWKRLKDWVTGK